MALPTASDNLFPKVIIRESADDGSDFSNPTADYRVLFLGEDGDLHLKDSSGTVTDVGGGGGGTAELLAVHLYGPSSQTVISTTSQTLADVDAANAVVTFTAPASGNVIVRVSAWADVALAEYVWGLREGSTNLACTTRVMRSGGQSYLSVPLYLSGLSAGSHTVKLSHAVDTSGQAGRVIVQDGSATGGATPKWGPLVMEVWAAP